MGVYVHFPYCRARCPYCDFDIHVRRRIRHDELAAAVVDELAARGDGFAHRRLVSIYFGGGTPSLWEPSCVARVIAAVRTDERLDHDSPLEITLEANPDDLPRAALDGLRAAGVNRLSLGAQSFAAQRLRQLGRLHGSEEIHRAVADARAAGFDDLSLDLIFGLPGDTSAALDHDLDALVSLAPDHVSAYQLTIEERTPFGAYARRGELRMPGAERQSELYELVEERLARAGFAHYEVSSYARRHAAVHNSLYWSSGEWLGLGPGAHSFRFLPGGGAERRMSPKNVDRYLSQWTSAGPGGRLPVDDGERIELLGMDELAREALWLGLRRLDVGVDRAAFAARFGEDPAARFAAVLGPLVSGGFVEAPAARIRLTRRGALLADEIGLRFL